MTRRLERSGALRAVSGPPEHDARGLAWLASTLGAAAVATGGALVTAGATWPSPGRLGIFALLAWFAVNRYTFFPTELAVTSESAVLVAAVLAFRDDAPFLGPWCVAALVGPLDAVHWEHRAFSRMGFNAAHQMLAVVAAAAAYAAVTARGDATIGAGGLAVLAAVASYAAVVWIAGVSVLHVWSRLRVGAAIRQLSALDWIVVPLGVLGALAGIAASTRGWWALPLVLVPVAFVPELALAYGRSFAVAFRASRRLQVLVLATGCAVLLAPVGAAVSGPNVLVVLGVLLLACFIAVEVRPRRRALVPPLSGVVVAVAVGVGGPGDLAWSSPARTLGALGAGLLVGAAAAFTAPTGARRVELARAGWAIVLLAVGVTGALAVPRFGAGAIAAPVVVVPAVCVLVAAWAAPPWSSAVLVPSLAPRHFARRRVVLGVLVASSVVTATAAARASSDGARSGLTLAALATLQVALAVTAVGARQWRVDPRPRRVVAVLLVTTAIAALVGLPLLARHGPVWLVPAAAAAGAVALWSGEGTARLGDDAERTADEVRRPG